MTICVGVAVNDCVVFAADSASTLVTTNVLSGQSEILNVYAHGDKVFNLYKGLPITAMTCGMGNIGSNSIATIAKELRRRLKSNVDEWMININNYTMEEIAVKARRIFYEEKFLGLDPRPPAPHSFEFWIGGYSANPNSGHEVWKIELINGECSDPGCVLTDGAYGLFGGGQMRTINRLVLGIDPAAHQVMIDAGVPDEAAAHLMDRLCGSLEQQFVTATMPVRDAIDFADFLVETTKRSVRFLPGADTVGGDTDIAVVTRYEGFKWIRRKHFYPAHLNLLETDHA